MQYNDFFPPHKGMRLKEIADRFGAELSDEAAGDGIIRSIAPVYRAKSDQLCYILALRNREELQTCEAAAIICDAALKNFIPSNIPALISKTPHTLFAQVGALMHPSAMRPSAVLNFETPVSSSAHVDPSARLEDGVVVESFAIIGASAHIGAGTRIGPGAIIGPNVQIGRACTIAGGASVLMSLLGNNVIIHNGARIGQDGFGYAPGRHGMLKVVQIGRVIIQDHVEVGANTTIDRGTMDDTVIGEGTKIDNQVQIGHNVRIGRHCGIVAKVGIAGSTRIGDGVMIGGAAGVNGHIIIGDSAQIAAMSGVVTDVPAGARYGGTPARPMKHFLREMAGILASVEERDKKLEWKTMTDETKATLGAADILEVMKLLPHRYPFLLIDKIIEIDGDNSAIGIKNVTVNEPYFNGHFPDRPIMPGVMIVEAMAQTAGAICARKQGESGYLVYFMTIDNARFRKLVLPGDQLKIHVVKQRQRGNVWKFHCKAKVEGALVAEADVGAMMVSEVRQ